VMSFFPICILKHLFWDDLSKSLVIYFTVFVYILLCYYSRGCAHVYIVYIYIYIYIYFLKISLPLYVSRIIVGNKKVHDFS